MSGGMTGYSKDYHDYVFRDGKLVGEFEAMYRHSEGVPWHQDEQDDWIDVRLTVDMLKDLVPFDEIHDLACGLGYYLALIRKHLGTVDCRLFGYDISETACVKAKTNFPEFTIQPIDLTGIPEHSSATRSPQPAGYSSFARRFGTSFRSWPTLCLRYAA
jgi:SAM-dependent methyltransferase